MNWGGREVKEMKALKGEGCRRGMKAKGGGKERERALRRNKIS